MHERLCKVMSGHAARKRSVVEIPGNVLQVKFDTDAFEMKCWYRDLRTPEH